MTLTAVFESTKDMELFAGWVSGRMGGTDPVRQQAGQAAPVQQQAPGAPAAPVQAPVAPPIQQQQPAAPVQQPVTAVPTSATSYTLDDLARAAMPLMDSGRQADLVGLLRTFGAESLPALPPAQYGAFATALRGLGAQI